MEQKNKVANWKGKKHECVCMYIYIYKCMMHQDDEIKNVNKRKVKKKKEQKRDVYYCGVWILTLKYI